MKRGDAGTSQTRVLPVFDDEDGCVRTSQLQLTVFCLVAGVLNDPKFSPGEFSVVEFAFRFFWSFLPIITFTWH